MTKSDIYPANHPTSVILNQLNEVASAVLYAAEGDKVEAVLERIAQIAAQMVNARYAALGVPDGQDGLRYFKTTGMTQAEIAMIDHLPRGRGLIGAIMQDRQTIRLENMRYDARSVGFPANHPPMTSLLGVPIQIGQRLFGTLYICDRLDGEPFSEADEAIIEILAGYAAVAISSSQVNEQRNRLTVLEERERIGMDLHDGVIQSLYAIGMHLDLMRMTHSAVATDMSEIITSLNGVIEDIRRYIMNLYGKQASQLTVKECLAQMLGQIHVAEGLRVTLDAPDMPPPFTPAIFEALCQMAHEAFSNAVRHAEASEIVITARQDGPIFEFQVQDNGKGFERDQASAHEGLGLRNLSQRAMMHYGSVEILSTPGSGTTVKIRVPIRGF
jgi:signal transduction histidine kinase